MARSLGIDCFLNIRSANGPTFAPDGRFVAYLTNITGVAQLWLVPVDGGWPEQLTFTGDSVRTAAYNPIRHEILYTMDKGGNEQMQIYRLKSEAAADHGSTPIRGWWRFRQILEMRNRFLASICWGEWE